MSTTKPRSKRLPCINAAYARLRFLFWQHVPPLERKTILERLLVGPERMQTGTSPLPQIVEKAALDVAKDQGKLGDLWAMIAPFCPSDLEPNPFRAPVTDF